MYIAATMRSLLQVSISICIASMAVACAQAAAPADAPSVQQPAAGANGAAKRAAEEGLAELLEAVRSGTLEPFDKDHPPSPLDQGHLVDCSDVDPKTFAAKGFNRLSQFRFNGSYAWGSVQRDGDAYCIYLEAPFDRGLNAADASTFLMAGQLKLGLSASYRRANNIPDEKPEDVSSLEKMLAAATERFGNAPSLPSLPKDLIDCRGFDSGPFADTANYGGRFSEWIFDGPYSWTYLHLPTGTCVFVNGRDEGRGLLAAEARTFLKAAHAGIDDPAHAAAQRWQNCMARASQESGSNIPDYESGSINSRRYRAFYAALDPDLKRLDDVQHAHIAAEKERWKRMPELARHVGDAPFDIEIRIRTTGRTRQLATLEADESTPGDKDLTHVRQTSWMLHVPSGRLLTFEDLFTDPKAVHEHIVTDYLDRLPEQLDRMMGSIVFLGEDGKENQQEYRDRYLSDAHKFATTPTEHFLNVQFGATGVRPLVVIGEFSKERLLDHLSASWHVAGTDLQPYLKPEFRSVFENEICPGLGEK